MKHLITLLLCAGVVVGCASPRMPPLARQADGELNAATQDVDAGFVRMRSGFSPAAYTAIILTPFSVSTAEMKDDKDIRLAQDMTGLLQTQLVNRLQLAGIFAKVIDATASAKGPSGERALRLEGEITNLAQGSRVMRSGVGFGAGAANAQIETRLLDVQSQNIQLVTADRRAGGGGKNSRQLVSESICEMAAGYVKMLERLSSADHTGTTDGPPCVVTSDWPVTTGSSVRVLVPSLSDKKLVGVVASATQDTLFFRQEPQISTRPIGVRDIRQLEIAQGTHTSRMRSIKIGLGIGTIFGGIIGAVTSKSHPPCQPNTICLNLDNVDRTMRAMEGGLLAGLVGALIGAGSPEVEETWVPVALPRRQ